MFVKFAKSVEFRIYYGYYLLPFHAWVCLWFLIIVYFIAIYVAKATAIHNTLKWITIVSSFLFSFFLFLIHSNSNCLRVFFPTGLLWLNARIFFFFFTDSASRETPAASHPQLAGLLWVSLETRCVMCVSIVFPSGTSPRSLALALSGQMCHVQLKKFFFLKKE